MSLELNKEAAENMLNTAEANLRSLHISATDDIAKQLLGDIKETSSEIEKSKSIDEEQSQKITDLYSSVEGLLINLDQPTIEKTALAYEEGVASSKDKVALDPATQEVLRTERLTFIGSADTVPFSAKSLLKKSPQEIQKYVDALVKILEFDNAGKLEYSEDLADGIQKYINSSFIADFQGKLKDLNANRDFLSAEILSSNGPFNIALRMMRALDAHAKLSQATNHSLELNPKTTTIKLLTGAKLGKVDTGNASAAAPESSKEGKAPEKFENPKHKNVDVDFKSVADYSTSIRQNFSNLNLSQQGKKLQVSFAASTGKQFQETVSKLFSHLHIDHPNYQQNYLDLFTRANNGPISYKGHFDNSSKSGEIELKFDLKMLNAWNFNENLKQIRNGAVLSSESAIKLLKFLKDNADKKQEQQFAELIATTNCFNQLSSDVKAEILSYLKEEFDYVYMDFLIKVASSAPAIIPKEIQDLINSNWTLTVDPKLKKQISKLQKLLTQQI